MTIPQQLLVLLLVVGLSASSPDVHNVSGCNDFKFKTEFYKVQGQETYELTITASGGTYPYHYLLLDSKNNLLSKDFSKNVFAGLQQGRYRCIVTDDQDCTKEQFIEVK